MSETRSVVYPASDGEVRLDEFTNLRAVMEKGEEDVDFEADSRDLERFRKDGWRFERGAPDAGAHRVYRTARGRALVATGGVVVRLRSSDDRAALRELGFESAVPVPFAPDHLLVGVPDGTDPLAAAERLRAVEAVVSAEPDFLRVPRARYQPTDPQYAQQWHWNNTGQNGGTRYADVRAERAWNATRGAQARIAVMDRGFQMDHPDYAENILPESAVFRLVRLPRLPWLGRVWFRREHMFFPDVPHGTRCAGMAAGGADNGVCGCGIAPEAGLLLVAQPNTTSDFLFALAIAYAAEPRLRLGWNFVARGADVISCSMDVEYDVLPSIVSGALYFVTTIARGGTGVPFFWAVENQLDGDLEADAMARHPRVIAVGRSDSKDGYDAHAIGPSLDFVAPGVKILTTTSGSGCGFFTGTSFATPCAAGIAALARAINPGLTWEEVRTVLRASCKPIGTEEYLNGRNDRFGFGRLDAARAVHFAAIYG